MKRKILVSAIQSAMTKAQVSSCRQVATLNGVSQYIEHPSTTPINITLDVKPVSGGNTGLPTGCPALTDGVRQQATFAFVGSLTEIGRNGANYFNGDIYSVSYDSGEDYPLDDGYANNPVVRNAAVALGAELWSAGDVLSAPAVAQYSSLGGSFDLPELSNPIFIEFDVSNMPLGGEMAARFGGLFKVITENGHYKFINFSPTGNQQYFQERTVGSLTSGVSITNITVKEAPGYGEMINPTEAMWTERCDL